MASNSMRSSSIKKVGIYFDATSLDNLGTLTELPAYPTSYESSDNLVSKSYDNMYGEFKDVPINIKLKTDWIFDCISDADLITLYGMIRSNIISKKSRFFYINTYIFGLGFITMLAYLGAPVSFKTLGAGKDPGSINYWSGELHWIEVLGVRLNDPTVIPT